MEFYQDVGRWGRPMCPSPKTVAQLIAGLGADVVSGAFGEGHMGLPIEPEFAWLGRGSDVGGDRH